MMTGDGYRLIPFVKSFAEDNKVQAKPLKNAKVFKRIKIKSKANKALLKKAQLDKRAALIDGCKEDFFYKFYTTDRKYRIYSRLTHKGIFVYQLTNRQTEKRLEITSVESLLCDRETLFSSKYLDYLYNHDTMVQQSKTVSMLGPNRLCVNFALNSTPNLPIKWEPPFKDTLEQLIEQAHREKKPLMIYYNKLYKFYCQTEDAEKLIALNSLIQCNQPDSESGLDPDDLITYLLYILDQCREWEEDNEKSFTESDCEETYSNFVLNVLLNKSSQQRDILNNISEQLLERMQLEKKPAVVYDEILSGAYKEAKNKIQSAVLYKIKEWYPDTGIPANAAIYFLRNILNKCAEKERDIRGMKDLLGAGNFSPTYTAQDAQKARIYIARKDRLRSLREELESWIKTHEFPFYRETFGVQGDKCREVRIPDKMLSEITKHLKDYIVHSRSRVRELSTDNIHKIINQLLDNQVINEQVIELEK